MNILFVGDVFGEMGRAAFTKCLKEIRETKIIHYLIVNGENIAHGTGITEEYYKYLLQQNTNVVTLGNHAFSNRSVFDFIDSASKLVRPLNYPDHTPGVGYVTQTFNSKTITVFQVMGRTFMNSALDCPFQATEKLLKEVKSDIYICDFHGEATSEKIAFGLNFDGRVQMVVGTHTHVQTNDAHILPKGTLFMSDAGMTGSLDGVIGVQPEIIIKKFVTGLPERHVPMSKGKHQFSGLYVELNDSTSRIDRFEIIHKIY